MNEEIKILIIEDELLFAKLCKDFLEERGFSISVAFDGLEGLEKFEKERPDLVILDLILPRLSGQEVLQKIRENPDQKLAKIPVIVLTNLSQEEEEKLKKLGADCYLVKTSITAEDLLVKVKEFLGKSS